MKLIFVTFIFLFIFNSCGPVLDIPDTVSEKEVKENFIRHQKDIGELKAFYNSITPKNMECYIEFISDTLVQFEVVNISNRKYPIKLLFEESNINPYNYEETTNSTIDSNKYTATTKSLELVKRELGWTSETFKEIKKQLDKSNCISIRNGEPANIGFKRSGFGMYFYHLFDSPIDFNLKTKYVSDTCHYKIFNDTLILEYRAGVYGPNCLTGK